MHQRIIRIGLALMLLAVGIAPGFAAVINCCCGPAEPAIEAKSCCSSCTCEIKADHSNWDSPDLVRVPSELETAAFPLPERLSRQVLVVESRLVSAAPQPQAQSPPERVLGRAPPLFCS